MTESKRETVLEEVARAVKADRLPPWAEIRVLNVLHYLTRPEWKDLHKGPITHPEAQGNKDLGEPPLTRLEAKDEIRTILDALWFLTEHHMRHYSLSCGEKRQDALVSLGRLEALLQTPLEITGEMAGAAHTYHYRPASHLETPIDHWKGVIRAALLQARSAAPTSPQPIKGDKTEALTDAATVQALEGL